MADSEEIKVEKFVTFSDGRCHCVFDDKSAIIIQPKGQYFTYFYPSGEILRLTVKNVIKKDTINAKLQTTLQCYNNFEDTPNSTINPYPTKAIILKDHKIIKSYWSLHKPDIRKKPDGTLKLKSIDSYTSVSLSPNGRLFKVSYPMSLASKKPILTKNLPTTTKSTAHTPKHPNSDITTFTVTTTQSNTAPVLKYTPSSHNPTVSMKYEYTRISQQFSIDDYPDRWSVALYLLWNRWLDQKQAEGYHVPFGPRWPERFIIDELENVPTRVVDPFGESGSGFTEDSSVNTSRCLDNLIVGEGYMYDNGDFISDLPQKFYDENGVVGGGDTGKAVWVDDDVSPATDVYGYKRAIHVVWCQDWTLRMNRRGEIEIFNHVDQSFVSTRDGRFFRLVAAGDCCQESCFVIDVIPNQRYDTTDGRVFTMEDLVQVLCEAQQRVVKASLVGEQESEEDRLLRERINLKNMNIIVDEQTVHGLATFQAFRNNSVCVRFDDRTVIRLYQNNESAEILTRDGHSQKVLVDKPYGFERHIQVAIEYYDHVFRSNQEKLAQTVHHEVTNDIVERELNRIRGFLSL